MSSLQDWQNEQASSNEKHKFGNLSLITNDVQTGKTDAGFSYTIPGIMSRDRATGVLALHLFKGKKLAQGGDAKMHVIAVLEATDSKGQVYQDIRDDLSFSKAMAILKNSLIDTFGPAFADVFATRGKIPVEVTLVPDGNNYTMFKVLRQFTTDAERIAAEKEYFKRFGGNQTNGNGTGIPADIEAKAEGLRKAVSDDALFKSLVEKDAVLNPYAAPLIAKFAPA